MKNLYILFLLVFMIFASCQKTDSFDSVDSIVGTYLGIETGTVFIKHNGNITSNYDYVDSLASIEIQRSDTHEFRITMNGGSEYPYQTHSYSNGKHHFEIHGYGYESSVASTIHTFVFEPSKGTLHYEYIYRYADNWYDYYSNISSSIDEDHSNTFDGVLTH
jgi:hypothetical protein